MILLETINPSQPWRVLCNWNEWVSPCYVLKRWESYRKKGNHDKSESREQTNYSNPQDSFAGQEFHISHSTWGVFALQASKESASSVFPISSETSTPHHWLCSNLWSGSRFPAQPHGFSVIHPCVILLKYALYHTLQVLDCLWVHLGWKVQLCIGSRTTKIQWSRTELY